MAVSEQIPIGSGFFTGEELAASAGSLDALDSSRESSGDDGVDADATGSADHEGPGVIAADTNDWLLSS